MVAVGHTTTTGTTSHAAEQSEGAGPYTGDWYVLGQFGKLENVDRLLRRRIDRMHVLHGDADRIVHSLLRNGLHARRATRLHRS